MCYSFYSYKIIFKHIISHSIRMLLRKLFVVLLKTIQAWTLLLLLIQLKFSIFAIQTENLFQYMSKNKSLLQLFTKKVIIVTRDDDDIHWITLSTIFYSLNGIICAIYSCFALQMWIKIHNIFVFCKVIAFGSFSHFIFVDQIFSQEKMVVNSHGLVLLGA